MEELLRILEKNARMPIEDIAAMLDVYKRQIQMVGAKIVRFLYDEIDKSYSLQGRRAAPCGGSFWTRNTL